MTGGPAMFVPLGSEGTVVGAAGDFVRYVITSPTTIPSPCSFLSTVEPMNGPWAWRYPSDS